MPKTKEFSIRMEDEPGTLGKICRALADAKVNILAFQSIPWEKKSLVRFVVDNPTTAKSVLDTQKLKYYLVNPLGHLSPNGSLANLAARYPFNGLPDLHRHFKLTIVLGLSECGQSAFVP